MQVVALLLQVSDHLELTVGSGQSCEWAAMETVYVG